MQRLSVDSRTPPVPGRAVHCHEATPYLREPLSCLFHVPTVRILPDGPSIRPSSRQLCALTAWAVLSVCEGQAPLSGVPAAGEAGRPASTFPEMVSAMQEKRGL